jgi:BirA family transcriptional regulator, biotin operon repressor / biotin---[acetyl-CoA-carboxylase] ligase
MTESEIRQHLTTRIFGKKIFTFDSIDSTNTYAKSLALQNDSEGSLIIAEEQTAGKGRLNRSWQAEKGKSLTFSVIITPKIPPEHIGILSLYASLAVAEAIENILPLTPVCKWPNDVLLDGRKVCGILSEVVFKSETSYLVIIGIGINVNQSIFPTELQEIATSLFLTTGRSVDRAILLAKVLERLESWHEVIQNNQTDRILQHWKKYCTMFDKKVTIEQQEIKLQGIAAGLAEDGGLIINTSDKQIKVLAGDIKILN